MELQPLPSRHLVAYAGTDDFADNTIQILARMGYEILSPERFEKLRRSDPNHQPDLFIVDELRIRELPSSGDTVKIPVVVLTRAEAKAEYDPRIVAAVKPPVGMHDLYRLLQQILEESPRSSMRARTNLPAVCRRSGQEWNATVVSLSENGCLLEGPDRVPLGTTLQLAFELPEVGTLHVHAETAYELFPHHGIVFSSISPRIRQALTRYITSLLARSPAGAPPTG